MYQNLLLFITSNILSIYILLHSGITDRWIKTIAIFVLVLSIFILFFDQFFFLPFLKRMAFPCGAFKIQIPERSNTSMNVTVPPYAKVFYWTTEPANTNSVPNEVTPYDAYKGFENAGMALANSSGVATLRFRGPPIGYTVPMGALRPHLHYRYCVTSGMLSEVVTKTI